MTEIRRLSPEMKQACLYPLTDGRDTTSRVSIEAVLGRSFEEISREMDACSPELQALLRIALTDSLPQDPRFAAAMAEREPVFTKSEILRARSLVSEVVEARTTTARKRRDLIIQAHDSDVAREGPRAPTAV